MSIEALRQVTLDRGAIADAVRLSDEAGWNQTPEDWAVFITHGTVLGMRSGDRLVATAAVLPYGADFAWLAMVLVTAAFRRRGIATRLVADCLALLCDTRRAPLLDATPHGAPVYVALGFSVLGNLTRWGGEGRGEPMRSGRIPFALDRAAFGSDRRFLLHDFLGRSGSLALAAEDGFIVLRPGRRAWHAGPLVGSPEAGEELLGQMIRAAPGPLIVDVLDGGSALEPLLHASGFRVRRRFHRMGLGRTSIPGDGARALAAAGPEFG